MTRQWETLREYDEIKYEFFEGIAKVTINRPEVRNAFTPKTVAEMIDAFCLEISGNKKSSFNFEEELENQAKVMEAHRISSNEKRFVSLDEIN